MKALGPYFFAKTSMTRGLEMLDKISYNHKLYDWKLNFMQQYQAKWIPKINTLILSGEKDCITPPCLFLNDANFNQDNILHSADLQRDLINFASPQAKETNNFLSHGV